jgi:hypothetical protein
MDLDRLEKELNGMLVEQDLYWLRNDAKLRAVEQTSSYEQFQNIVKVGGQRMQLRGSS